MGADFRGDGTIGLRVVVVDVIVDAATGGARNFLGLKLAGLPEASGEMISFGFGFVVFGLSQAPPFF